VRKGLTRTWHSSLRARLAVAVASVLLPAAALLIGWVDGGGEAGKNLGVVLVAILVTGALGLAMVARRILEGLHQLREVTGGILSGEQQPFPPFEGEDEFDTLGQTLRDVCHRMDASHREIEERNRGLEGIINASTEQLRQKNLALAFQNEKVIEANRLKSAFLASVSHELRTPLNAIMALSEMLRDGIAGPLNEEQAKQAGIIYKSGENLLHLINQVLDLSKIESGRMEVRRETVDIVAYLLEAAASLRPLAEEKGLRLTWETEGEGTEVSVDPEKLRQVFVNLLGNAIKFTEDGSVTARIRLLPDEDLLYVEVQDTGPGIPRKERHLIFQEFRQVEKAAAGGKGTGLGLAISKKLVNLLGGDIWVDSVVGSGSRFAYVVPLRLRREEAPRVESEDSLKAPGRVHPGREQSHAVLVVDDDVVESGVLGRYLRQQGVEVLTALDGLEAYQILQRETIGLVLLDLFSTGEEGFQLVRRMKRQGDLRSIPVIANTRRRFSDEEMEGLKPQVRAVFEKGSRGVSDLIGLVTDTLKVEPGPGSEALAHRTGAGELDEVA